MGFRQSADLWTKFRVAFQEDAPEEHGRLASMYDTRRPCSSASWVLASRSPKRANSASTSICERTLIGHVSFNRRRHIRISFAPQVLTIKDADYIQSPHSTEMPMSKKSLSSVIALAAIALVAAPIGFNSTQDTAVPVADGERSDCALSGDAKLKCWDGTIVHAGKSYDCNFNGETVFCKYAEPKA
jgi:hypothetical protein